MKIYALSILACSLLLAGCANQNRTILGQKVIDPSNIQSVSDNVAVDENTYTGRTTIKGPVIIGQGEKDYKTYFIRGWIAPSLPSLDNHFQIYVTAYFPEWAFLQQAYASGKPIDTVLIDRKVMSCSRYGCGVMESVGVNLTREQMTKYAENGLSFQVSGKSDSVVMSIPSQYFAAILSVYDQQEKS